MKKEIKSNFETLLTQYPSGMEINSLLASKFCVFPSVLKPRDSSANGGCPLSLWNNGCASEFSLTASSNALNTNGLLLLSSMRYAAIRLSYNSRFRIFSAMYCGFSFCLFSFRYKICSLLRDSFLLFYLST